MGEVLTWNLEVFQRRVEVKNPILPMHQPKCRPMRQSTNCGLMHWPYNVQDASVVCRWCVSDFVWALFT